MTRGHAHASDVWLSISQAADELGVHPETLRRAETAGLISPHRTPGGHRRFRRTDIERLRDGLTPCRPTLTA